MSNAEAIKKRAKEIVEHGPGTIYMEDVDWIAESLIKAVEALEHCAVTYECGKFCDRVIADIAKDIR